MVIDRKWPEVEWSASVNLTEIVDVADDCFVSLNTQ